MQFLNAVAIFLLFLSCPMVLDAQMRRVPAEALGERLVVILPLQGVGTEDDPVRPKYAPAPLSQKQFRLLAAQKVIPTAAERELARKQAIVSFAYVVGDDGKTAIVEFVAYDRAAFSAILKDPVARVFEKRELTTLKEKADAGLVELRKIKKDFDWNQLRTAGF